MKLEKSLGQTIRETRKARKMTMHRLSQLTKLDRATLSRMENGKMTGTLQAHMSIAKALSVRLSDLLEKALELKPVAKARKPNSKTGSIITDGATACEEILTRHDQDLKMSPTRVTIYPGSKTPAEQHALGVECFVYVLKGAIEVCFTKDSRLVSEGKSLYFKGSNTHFFKNPTSGDAIFILVQSAH